MDEQSDGRGIGIAFARHRPLVAVMVVVIIAFAIYGVAIGANLALSYAIVVTLGGVFVLAMEPAVGFSRVAVVGLTLWAIGHLSGGTIQLDDDRILYNALILGHLHFDNVVHFIGFGTAGLAWWEATRAWLPARPGHRLGAAVATWLAGMGVGAFNEVVEFFTTLLVKDTNVGGYQNTGRDLVANMLGAAVAGLIAARRDAPAVSSAGEGRATSGA